jgi:hypothetical protein
LSVERNLRHMTRKASDLSSSERRRALDSLRRQVGDAQYDELVRDHDEDSLVELVLHMASEPSPGNKSHGRAAKWACFAVLWSLITLGVTSVAGERAAVAFFFSPCPYLVLLLLFATPQLLGHHLAERLPTGCGVVVAVVIGLLFVGMCKSIPEESQNNFFAIAIVGGISSAFVAWLADLLVRLMRRIFGRRR